MAQRFQYIQASKQRYCVYLANRHASAHICVCLQDVSRIGSRLCRRYDKRLGTAHGLM